MKSKSVLLAVLVAFIAITSLSACKSRCDCPTFSKNTTKAHTQVLPL